MTTTQRLNKFLALTTGASRREADEWIQQGRVTLDGAIAHLGAQVSPQAQVTLDGRALTHDTHHIYLALHKPIGYVCSRKQQGTSATIYTLLPEEFRHLKPVGRLDRDSSGLLLLTNDGDFAHRMTHPSFHKIKIYEVTLDKPLQPLHQQMISDFGIMLEDGKSQFLVERVEPLASSSTLARVTRGGAAPEDSDLRAAVSDETANDGSGEPTYKITMSEGRNRQIRRTFAALGYTVTSLHRTQFGNYILGNLESSTYQTITP